MITQVASSKPDFGIQPDRSHWMFDQLIGWWPIMSPGTVEMRDISGFQQHGTFAAGISGANLMMGGEQGWCLEADGDDTRDVSVTGNNTFWDVSDQSFSLCCWVYPDTGLADNDVMIQHGKFSTGGYYTQLKTGSPWKPNFFFHDGVNQEVKASDSIASQTWSHLVFTRDGTLGSWYINGFEVSGYDTQDSVDSITAYGGALEFMTYSQNGFNWVGRITDFRFFKRVLTPGEIYEMYRNPWAPWSTRILPHFEDSAAAPTTPLYYNHLKQLCGQN